MAVVGAEKGKKARISAASARAHTRNSPSENRSSSFSTAGILVWSVLLLLVGVAASLVFKSITPPPPKLLNSSSPGGLTVTAPRVRMRDGRFLAYKERGVPREIAQYHVISVHGYGRSRHDIFRASEELLNDLSIYLVAFDRAGYGQSDPHPERTIKSAVNDIEDFANELGLKPKFYVIVTSIGSYTAWGLIKYLPERIAGIAMSAPVANYWWSGVPPHEVNAAWNTQVVGDKVSLRVAHYVPWLLYWYMTQSWFPTSSVAPQTGIGALNQMDRDILKNIMLNANPEELKEGMQQGLFESGVRDMIIMFSSWEFSPATLENPFVNTSARVVHIWQGSEDYLVPVTLQRYIAKSLPWVHYHELPGKGHFLNGLPGYADDVVQQLIVGDIKTASAE
jgi:pimeloyl-ACP methyl ester carboxylesterase